MKIRKPDTKDVKGGLLAVFMLCFLMLLHHLMYNPLTQIKHQVSRMGYAADNLVIEQVDFWKAIYKASTTVTDKDGQEIEYWQISLLPGTQTVSYAKPYYEME